MVLHIVNCVLLIWIGVNFKVFVDAWKEGIK